MQCNLAAVSLSQPVACASLTTPIARRTRVALQLFELLSVAVLETRRRPSEAWEDAALDLVATGACLTDADLAKGPADEATMAGGQNGKVPANGDAVGAQQGWADVRRTKERLREAGELLRSFYKLGYKPAATFEAMDRVRESQQLVLCLHGLGCAGPEFPRSCYGIVFCMDSYGIVFSTSALGGARHGQYKTLFPICVQILRSPLVAAAVVSVIHAQVTSEDFYTDQVALAALPHLIILLLRAVRLQPRAHARILRLACAALPVVGAERPEAAKSYVRLLLELLLRGDALAALAAVNEWARNADPALVRFFIGQVRPQAVPCRPSRHVAVGKGSGAAAQNEGPVCMCSLFASSTGAVGGLRRIGAIDAFACRRVGAIEAIACRRVGAIDTFAARGALRVLAHCGMPCSPLYGLPDFARCPIGVSKLRRAVLAPFRAPHGRAHGALPPVTAARGWPRGRAARASSAGLSGGGQRARSAERAERGAAGVLAGACDGIFVPVTCPVQLLARN